MRLSGRDTTLAANLMSRAEYLMHTFSQNVVSSSGHNAASNVVSAAIIVPKPIATIQRSCGNCSRKIGKFGNECIYEIVRP